MHFVLVMGEKNIFCLFSVSASERLSQAISWNEAYAILFYYLH